MDELPFSCILRRKKSNLGKPLPFSRETSSSGRLGEEGKCFVMR